jgi:sialic acid synthase SpsE/quercetin dioxygenase-like cupin family protein
MANNHMGSVEHGIRIIRAMGEVCEGFPFRVAVKLQYRDISVFIHPAFRSRFDLKYVKRFSETSLSWDQYKQLKDEIVANGFISICTPWDEISVDRIVEHGYDYIKVPSCYFTDWPLLEQIAKHRRPVIASTAGASLTDIDNVVSFFSHREIPISLMHCVGEYPTKIENLNLNQIRVLKARYPGVEIGYSTHEDPNTMDAVKMALCLGATMFEKHVGVPTPEWPLNPYSATPEQVHRWLGAALEATQMLGIGDGRSHFTSDEIGTLRALHRGVFAKRGLKEGEKISPENCFFAIPNEPDQLVANDMGKYIERRLNHAVSANQAIGKSDVTSTDKREMLYRIIQDVKKMLKKSKTIVPGQLELEISHHYGLEKFEKFGSTIITVVNRDYCKRVIVLLPGQTHPEQFHEFKDETYHILYGEIDLELDGKAKKCKANDVVVISKGIRHGFKTSSGTVIEEVSSTYKPGDSHYTDNSIETNPNRKTFVTYWME